MRYILWVVALLEAIIIIIIIIIIVVVIIIIIFIPIISYWNEMFLIGINFS